MKRNFNLRCDDLFQKKFLSIDSVLENKVPYTDEDGTTRGLLQLDEILNLLQTGDKIAAVKLYQKETGIPFKAAIEAVKKLIQDFP